MKVLELEFSPAQIKTLQKFLPKGFSLEQLSKKRDKSPRPTKKLITNDGKDVKKIVNGDIDPSIASS
eukprot:CAMPEP_0114579050 /NCGR_PEP_ID=MMETSP0125-20121206/3503_1 /TAXON_ID=485358 ORGANISM="Aristerostoma sp., Strain ATCC 50986" /NCGR_SAMPLE_ID=MMETSP0125 /ASSEMBLY_ACC=CAM_ASM_000245 /LENGTH=66 /DNA_ID=CAMNT_0001769559 /DNA_START=110 /DNA_END=310 /DNA_ORIENTATION=+